MKSPGKFLKDMRERAVHEEAVNICTRRNENYYFLPKYEQTKVLEIARKNMRAFMAEAGIV